MAADDLHREIFKELMEHFGYTGRQLSAWSQLHVSKISRFLNGKHDLEAGEFFMVLSRCPKEAQDYFWARFLGDSSLSIEQTLKTCDNVQLARFLRLLADRMQQGSTLVKPLTIL